MSILTMLYAERDRLRGLRAHHEQKLEELVQPTAENARAINRAEQGMRRKLGSGCDPGAYEPQRTTTDDVPEFFGAILGAE